MDEIHVTGIRAYGYVGFLPEEQRLGQWFQVDMTLWLDITAAAQSDRLEDTYDYRYALTTVQKLIETSTYQLIESLIEAIAQAILQQDQRIQKVRVRLSKVAPPIPNFSGQIGIEITRTP